jgi:molybdopterin converting factor small subunit
MAVTVALPSALQSYAGGSLEVVLEGRPGTVGEALDALAGRHAGVMDRVTDERGELRQHVNVFLDGDNIRWLEGFATPLAGDSTIVIVPAVSGG